MSAQQTHPVPAADVAEVTADPPPHMEEQNWTKRLSGAPSLLSPSELGAYLR